MTLEEFTSSLENPNPDSGLTVHLKALWHDAKGDWNKAHQLVDQLNDLDSCIVHAYLHRKEGDIWNADYWYKRSKSERPNVTLDEEWEQLAKKFLETKKP